MQLHLVARAILILGITLAVACGGSDPAPPTVDMAGGSGTKRFGEVCTGAADCESPLLCESFAMHTIMRCTKMCTVATQATDCPAPSAGTCTPNNYCRFAM